MELVVLAFIMFYMEKGHDGDNEDIVLFVSKWGHNGDNEDNNRPMVLL